MMSRWRFTAMPVVIGGILCVMIFWLVAISAGHGRGCSLAFDTWSVVIMGGSDMLLSHRSRKIRSRAYWVHRRWRISQRHSVVSAMWRNSRRSGFSSITKLMLNSNWIDRIVDLQDTSRPRSWFFSGLYLDSLISKRSREDS